jgi:restriction system protein
MAYAILKGALSRFAAAVRPARPAGRAVHAAPWKLDAEQWSLELLRRLEWRRLEELAVAYFDATGFTARVSHPGADGADITLHAEGGEAAVTLARCKAWNAYSVGIKPLHALHAQMAASGAQKGLMLTSGRFSQEARTFAAGQGIELVDGAAFLSRIIALPREKSLALLRFATEGDFLTPTCPACAIKMVSRQSTQGGRKFWGCRNYPRCKHFSYATANAPA